MTRLWLMPLATGGMVLSLSCGGKGSESKSGDAAKAASRPPAISVRTAAVEPRTVERAIDVTGSLVADETVTISSEVPGRVTRVNFDFGQSVRKGDVVAELDRTQYALQVERAKASLSQALARIGLNPDQEDAIPKTTPAIRQARAQYEDAKSRFDNAQRLVESGDIARERFVEIEKALRAREAALQAAEDDLRTQLANVQAILAEKKLAEDRLADTIIYAPFDGAVSSRVISPGEQIKDTAPIMTLVKSWPLRLHLDVPEVAAAAVKIGDALTFTTEAIPGKTFRAVVRQLNPALEARSRSLSAEARLVDPSQHLRPGLFVQVRLVIARAVPILTVPKQAVYTVAGLSKIYSIRDNKAREIRLDTIVAGDGWVEVHNLASGDAVAVSNLQNLTDGAEVAPAAN